MPEWAGLGAGRRCLAGEWLVVAAALLTAALVAWGAVRVRPPEVLRYE